MKLGKIVRMQARWKAYLAFWIPTLTNGKEIRPAHSTVVKELLKLGPVNEENDSYLFLIRIFHSEFTFRKSILLKMKKFMSKSVLFRRSFKICRYEVSRFTV